jgi:hypothetical protein
VTCVWYYIKTFNFEKGTIVAEKEEKSTAVHHDSCALPQTARAREAGRDALWLIRYIGTSVTALKQIISEMIEMRRLNIVGKIRIKHCLRGVVKCLAQMLVYCCFCYTMR